MAVLIAFVVTDFHLWNVYDSSLSLIVEGSVPTYLKPWRFIQKTDNWGFKSPPPFLNATDVKMS